MGLKGYYVGNDYVLWSWQTTSNFSYTNWVDGEPDGTDICVRIKTHSSYAWADYTCTNPFLTFCEILLN